MKTDFKTIIFYIVLAICGLVLLWFTTITTMDYSRNLVQGYAVSAVVALSYAFVLYKSHLLFHQKRIGLAYFFVIGFFLVLAFIQMIGCSNSVSFRMH